MNCPFYFKNGACRYGDKCTRRHLKPSISQTLLFPRLYDNPPVAIAMAGISFYNYEIIFSYSIKNIIFSLIKNF